MDREKENLDALEHERALLYKQIIDQKKQMLGKLELQEKELSRKRERYDIE